jgi:hypothetical protein
MLVLTWLVFAGLATAAGFAAVGLVGQGLEIESSSAAAPTPRPSDTDSPSETASGRPTSTARPSSSATTAGAGGRTASRSVRGNFVSATCRGSSVTLSASPAPGWSLDDYLPGPGREARARFRSDTGDVEFKVSCSDGGPVFETKDDPDERGGDG